jgi:gluconate 2-dehydrogenase gamma chain
MSVLHRKDARMSNVTRRTFIKIAGATAATLKATATPAAAPASGTKASVAPQPGRGYFTVAERATLAAMVERLIPTDDTGPGAREAGVAAFIDLQLAGPWGAGERLYRSGPWHPGEPTQGYQLAFTPAELFRHALRGIDADLAASRHTTFAQLPPSDQDAYLQALEKGGRDLDGVPSNVFFESLLEVTLEGFFSDPVYGGNVDKVGWRLIGFPGAYANYYALVDQHGIAFDAPPISLAEDGRGHVHTQPMIRADATTKER